MKKLIVYEIIFSLLVGGISYITSNNLFLSLGVLISYGLFLTTVLNWTIMKTTIKWKRYHQCYTFINTYIISLSSSKSIVESFETSTLKIDQDFQEELNGIKDLTIMEKIEYLQRFFCFNVYHIFINIIELYIEQGGDILAMSHYLFKEARLIEEYIYKCKALSIRKVVELIVLWTMSFVVLISMRFGLAQFFEEISKMVFYPICLSIYYLFFLICIFISVKTLIDVDIRGYTNYEKN